MKKIISIILLLTVAIPALAQTDTVFSAPQNAKIEPGVDSASVSWQNPEDLMFEKTTLFRSYFPIESYFTFEAVEGICEKIYEGKGDSFTDTGLAANLPYYYILFSEERSGNYSKAIVLEKDVVAKEKASVTVTPNTLANASATQVNDVTRTEAGLLYRYNGEVRDVITDENSRRLALFIVIKSPHDLTDQDRNAISYFIHSGTPTTILLGSGERAGVLNSYLSVFDKLPTNELEWQDVIKIGNGRWPDERNVDSETEAANNYFSAVYKRSPNMEDPKDNAAVTVIAYGLRPANRNLESEKNAINIYRDIFGQSPTAAADWDIVRAIAYSGATR